jgi:eukaryotic-like serine/threonine-protein kinase
MGSVYLAHDQGIDRSVAIKLLRADDVSTRRRFQTEAQSAGRLKHANIVTVYEYGELDSGPYLVMEFIEGRTIAQILERGEFMTLDDRLSLLIQACQGLAYAHRAGVVHRDIKPSNLMVDRDGTLKIVDFGIARTTDRDMTLTGRVVGTPAYMSPEQIQGETADHRSDVFALGLVAFELLTGQCAYSGNSDYAVINQIVNGRPAAFSHANSRLERLMIPVMSRVLAREPASRHQSVDAFAADLASVRVQLASDSADPDTPDHSTQPTKVLHVRKRRWPVALAVAVVMAAAIGVQVQRAMFSPVVSGEIPPPASAPTPSPVLPTAPPMAAPPVQAPPGSDGPPKREPVAAAAAAAIPAAREAPLPEPPAPERINARLDAAKRAEAAGDFEAAIMGYEAVLAEHSRSVAAADGLASARRAQSRARDALMKTWLAEAQQKLADGAYDDAIAVFESVLGRDAMNQEASDGVARARKAKAAEEAIVKSRAKRPPKGS